MSRPAPTERSFGISVGAVCSLLAILQWWQGRDAAAIALVSAAGMLMTSAVLAPAALRVPNALWWRFAQVLGWLNTRVLLTLFFFVIVAPVACIMRLCGRNVLRPRQTHTAWSSYARQRDSRHYEHMF